MAEIGGFLILIGAMLWLGVGGWACMRLSDETPRESVGILFCACLVLAPFMAGAAIARDMYASKGDSQ